MTVLLICAEKYCPGSKYLPSWQGRCDDRVQYFRHISKNSYYYCPDILKTYQRETKLFEFSQDSNRATLKIRKNDVTL